MHGHETTVNEYFPKETAFQTPTIEQHPPASPFETSEDRCININQSSWWHRSSLFERFHMPDRVGDSLGTIKKEKCQVSLLR